MSELYPLRDYHPLNKSGKLRAKYTGEFRPPKRGEWYLSGAIVEAYRAPNDLTTPFHIAKIVEVETKTITYVKEILQ